MNKKIFKLQSFIDENSKVFTGRDEGEKVRLELKLEDYDYTDTIIEVIIPKGVISFNPSFFLGMFGPTIKNLGEEKFRQKYKFNCNECVLEDIEDGIRKAVKRLREIKNG